MRFERMVEGRRAVGTIAAMAGIMSIERPFWWAWTQLLQFSLETLCGPNEYIHVDAAEFSLHDVARNHLAGRFRGDWLLMLDCDVIPEPDLCARMLRLMQLHDIDVLLAMYPYKSEALPILNVQDPATKRQAKVADWDRGVDLTEFTGGGAGALMVTRRCIDRILSELKEDPFNRIEGHGEDFSFYSRVRKCGMQCWAAARIEAGHLDFVVRRVAQPGELDLNRYSLREVETEGRRSGLQLPDLQLEGAGGAG